jgi:hypothetical protein
MKHPRSREPRLDAIIDLPLAAFRRASTRRFAAGVVALQP